MSHFNYEHTIIRQLAGHYFSDEMDDYEEKINSLDKEFKEDPDGDYVIGDRDTIEQMVNRYISAQMSSQ
jgi:hypothetical protein